MLTHANHIAHCSALLKDIGIDSSIRYLHAAPMFHIADSLFMHLVTAAGGTHFVLPKFDVISLGAAIATNQITDTILVPTMIQMTLQDPDNADRVFGNLKRLFYGASPMPVGHLEVLIRRYPGLQLYQLYGQTESSPVLTMLTPREHSKESLRRGLGASAGRPIHGTRIQIVDPEGREVAMGKMGEIVAQGPQVMKGYWNRPEESSEALRDGWLYTGDAGCLDLEGYLYVTDRIKDMIISGGENVYSIEVEQVIYQIAAIEQCCVVGLPHERWGESVHAVIVLKSGHSISEEAVMSHCAMHLADFKRPRGVTIRKVPLPISGAGKILKREVRRECVRAAAEAAAAAHETWAVALPRV
jgi:acyl-CoA synthetase (AMP-forming)/AMP-acid ligase II